VENKKIDTLFGLVVIAFLVVFIFLMDDINAKRANNLREYTATVTNIINLKNNKIRVLSYQLEEKQKENNDLKNTLADTRNSLESLSKKLAQPTSAGVSTPVPVAK